MGWFKVGLTFSEGRGLRILGSKDQALEGSEEGVGHFFFFFNFAPAGRSPAETKARALE